MLLEDSSFLRMPREGQVDHEAVTNSTLQRQPQEAEDGTTRATSGFPCSPEIHKKHLNIPMKSFIVIKE